MSATEPPEERLTPAEERLLALLVLLRAAPAAGAPAFTQAVMRRARWQHVLRQLLEAAGTMAGALVDALLLGRRSGARPGERRP